MEKNILLTISYDGTDFHGWQRQPNVKTVQGHLEKVLSRLFREDIVLNGTSRTDAGVHALGQRASFKADISIPTDRIARVVNNALAGCEKGSFSLSPVRILKAEEKAADFHARFDSVGKKYIYKIKNVKDIDIFQRNYVYHVADKLNTEEMRKAANVIAGTHDFKSFEASGGTERETTVRSVYSFDIVEEGNDIELHISGDGFLYNMVRIIAGTLTEVGLGKLSSDDIIGIIEARDRSRAGHTAPPYGLYLTEVYYSRSDF